MHSHSRASFAGRWAAKEAVIKALSASSPDAPDMWKGAGAAMAEIEVLRSVSGAPEAHLRGHAADVASALGVSAIKLSISHSGGFAVAQAHARGSFSP